jgi:hypothetical protein
MERDGARGAVVGDPDPDSEQVAKLPLERHEVGIGAPFGQLELAGRLFLTTRSGLRLAHRKPTDDDLLGQLLWIGRGGDGAGMTHADVAADQRLADEHGQVEQPQQIGDVATRFVDQAADIVGAVTVMLD